MIWGIPKSKGGIVIRKTFSLMVCILLLLAILAGCTKTTEIVTLPPPTATQVPATKTPLTPTATQVPATKTLSPPTDTPAMPTQTLEPSPTVSSINGMPMIGRVSVASDGTQGNGLSNAPAISADGRYVTFTSNASNLVEGDTNGGTDIFVHDRVTGETQRVSVASDGTQGNGPEVWEVWIASSISADGRYVAFSSLADNLVEGDTNGAFDFFVYDRMTGETTRVSVPSCENGGCNGSPSPVGPSISADGRYVAFSYYYTGGIIVYDRVTRETTRVPISIDGTQVFINGDVRSISADGRYMAFRSEADNLVEGDTNGAIDFFVYDRMTGETTRVSVASDGTQANGTCAFYALAPIFGPSISADGLYVAFSSNATNLVKGFTEYPDIYINASIYVHNQVTGETTLVSVSSDGTQANGCSWLHAISADGRYVVFSSDATNLVDGVIDGNTNIYMHDRVTGSTTLVSVSGYGQRAYNDYWGSSISADGRYLAFSSDASNLVDGDTNGVPDIFVIDLWASK
jgi:Tol biopolymer transport system component